MYQVTYTLKSKLLGDRVAEEITISTESDSHLAIDGDVHTLREIAFKNSAAEAFYQEILSRTRTANNDLQKASQKIDVMRIEWEKATEFMAAQGLSKAVPEFPIRESHHYDPPALQASTHIGEVHSL